jgi:CRISPR-associated protein Csm4
MGDTIFGHFCWQVVYDLGLLNEGLDRWIACYEEKPFAVFSSAWPIFSKEKAQYALKRPALPTAVLYPERVGQEKRKLISERKELLKKQWMIIGQDLSLHLNAVEYKTDQELFEEIWKELMGKAPSWALGYGSGQFISKFDQPHNSINRLTMTTDEGGFAPFAESASYYYPGTELAIFILVDEEATDINRVVAGLERIGKWGYGKNASTGLGRFEVCQSRELNLTTPPSPNACYTLAPCVPQKGVFFNCSFNPFVRFGRHGDIFAQSGNPFKNPVLMAGEGAVFFPQNSDIFEKPYIGRAVMNTSKAILQSVVQGYAPYLPFRLEGAK